MNDFTFLFDQVFGHEGTRQWLDRRYAAPVSNVEETDTHFLLSLDLPGVAKKDINIEVRGNQLVVSGERRGRGDKEPARFERSFTLSNDVDTQHIEANHEDGVLTLGLPKVEKAKPRQIKIAENAGSFFGRFLKSEEKRPEHAA